MPDVGSKSEWPVSERAAALHAITGTIMPMFMVVMMTRFFGARKSWTEGLSVLPFALFGGVAFTVPYFLTASIFGPEFPSLLGGLVGLAIVSSAARKGFLLPKDTWDFPPSDQWPSEWVSGLEVRSDQEGEHPEMSAGKLHSLSPRVLFDNLPSVPTEAIAREFAPVVDPSCAPPAVTQVSQELIVYEVCDTAELAWAKMVSSPVPIASILGKFTNVRSLIRVSIEDIQNLPAEAPKFSADRVLNSFFNINIEGTEQGDLATIHTTMFVEKRWIQANDIHKWSIAFNRFDEELGAWVPVTAKRVRETTDRIYYTGVLPGFSTFAITGGTAPVTPQFTVREPTDRPFIQRAGPQTTVAAEITNDGSELLHYVANLWINDTIDRTMSIRVEPGETKQFEFPAFTMDPGDYDVRVERLLGSYKILAPTQTLTPAPVTAAPTLLGDGLAVATWDGTLRLLEL